MGNLSEFSTTYSFFLKQLPDASQVVFSLSPSQHHASLGFPLLCQLPGERIHNYSEQLKNYL